MRSVILAIRPSKQSCYPGANVRYYGSLMFIPTHHSHVCRFESKFIVSVPTLCGKHTVGIAGNIPN